ncbi:MAG: NAD(P)-binding domain-containing protein [Gammaproteobacteria bacterium]
MTKTDLENLPVAVIGAGPVGLAAAAHLITRGIPPLILEAGAQVAENLRAFGHVRLFSPWRYNLDKAATRLLLASGWVKPDEDLLPSAGQMAHDYLQPLAELPALAPHLKMRHKVVAISRQWNDKVKTPQRSEQPFVIRVATQEGEREFLARAVLDASGTWNQPNPLGTNGLPALGEVGLSKAINYGMPDILGTAAERYRDKRVLVIGSGHSAAGNLIALAQLAEHAPQTQLVWAIRGKNFDRIFGGGSADGLPARGELGQRLKALRDSGRLELHTGFHAHEVKATSNGITLLDQSGTRIDGLDEIIVSTGSRPDLAINRELRIGLDSWLESSQALAPLIDPNEHSCGTVRPHGYQELSHPEANFFIVGAKSYGRAPNFLMATGYEQVRSIAAALAGDYQAAAEVQLDLPQTGVCSSNLSGEATEEASGAACCGAPSPQPQSESCCATAPSAGARGCS